MSDLRAYCEKLVDLILKETELEEKLTNEKEIYKDIKRRQMVYIDKYKELCMDISRNRRRFPNTYTKHEKIKKICRKKNNTPLDYVFSVEIAKFWVGDRYGFKVIKNENNNTYIKYIGILKNS